MTDWESLRADLARRLRELYDESSLVETAVAARSGFSQSKVSRFLNGRSVPSPADVQKFAKVLGAGDALARDLADHAGEIERGRASITPSRVVLQRGSGAHQRRILQMERDADRVLSYDPTLLPRLLQTEAYMGAVARAGAPAGTSDADIDDFVRARRERQDTMARRTCLFVLPETVLLWPALLPPAGMADQCRHIAALSTEREGWEVRLIARALSRPGRPIYVLNGFDLYERPGDDSAVLFGTTAGNVLVTDPREVRHHRELVDRLLAEAVSAQESRGLLARVADEYLRL